MASITKTSSLNADTIAYIGTFAALITLALAVFRLVYQTHANGGYDLFAGLTGCIWWSHFGAFFGLSIASFITVIVIEIRKENHK